MHLLISTRGLRLTQEERQHVERRVGFALGRFGDRIGLVRLRLTDLNGPKGGIDKRCVITVRVIGVQEIRAEATVPLPMEAVDCASDRVSRAVKRSLAKMREQEVRRLLPRSPWSTR